MRRAPATAGILIGLLLAALDNTLVGPIMPLIMAELEGMELYALPMVTFAVAQTLSLPVWGKLADLRGRRRFHLLGVVLFLGGAALSAQAPSLSLFVAFRTLQGLGAGALMALSFTMIGDLYQGPQRAKIQGAVGGVWALAALVGPFLGGLVAQHASWRWVFYLNIPVGILSASLIQASWKEGERRPDARLDVPGAILMALAATALISGFSAGGRSGWGSAAAVGSFVAALVLTACLVAVERRARDPFLAYHFYRIPLFGRGAAAGVCAMTCLFGAVIYIPLFLIGVKGLDPVRAGSVLFPMMIPWVLCSSLSGFLVVRLGYRALATIGMALCLAAFLLLFRMNEQNTWLQVAGAMMLLGAGLGVTIAPLLTAAQNVVPRERLGAATSLIQFTRAFGGAIGISLMSSLMAGALGSQARDLDANLIGRRLASLPPDQVRALTATLLAGLHRVFLFGVGAAALGVLIALTIPGGKESPAPPPETP